MSYYYIKASEETLVGGDQNSSFSGHTLHYTSPNSGHHIQEINGSELVVEWEKSATRL